MSSYLRTLFLHPPSTEGFDGGAGAEAPVPAADGPPAGRALVAA